MKRLLAASVVLLTLACQDGTPLQPELGTSPELSRAQAQTANSQGDVVKMVPSKFGGAWEVTGADYTGCLGSSQTYTVDIEGNGTGTHTGRYQASWTVTWGCVDGAFVASDGTITGANGDAISFFGSADRDPPTTHPFYADGTWALYNGYFDGGTGRFEHAEGWYDCVGTYNETFSGGTMSCKGMISSVGSSG